MLSNAYLSLGNYATFQNVAKIIGKNKLQVKKVNYNSVYLILLKG